MNSTIEVKMGGLEIITNETDELKTFVGSCVAICLFDASSKIAGMAHVVLPQKTGNKHPGSKDPGKYADEALPYLISMMIKKGADQSKIQAKMAGGATIFAHESEKGIFNVGPRNVLALKQILKKYSIPVISEDVGANFGKWVRFNMCTCNMTITSNLKKLEKVI